MTDEIREAVRDEVRLATDSSIRALTEMQRTQQLAHAKLYEDVVQAVREQIQITVNGKIDKMTQALNAHIAVVQPMVEQFNNNKGFWNTLSDNSKKAGIVAAMLTGIAILGTYLSKLFLK